MPASPAPSPVLFRSPRPRFAGARFACALMLAAVPLAARADPQLRAVTLSTAGTALLEATLPIVEGRAALTLRRADLDGFLKSVVPSDPGGGLIQMRLPGPGAFDDAFAALPVTPDDLQSLPALLRAMAGAAVGVERRGARTEGTVLGVEERSCEDGPCPVVMLRTKDGALRQVALDDTLVVDLTDPADGALLDAAQAALRLGRAPRQVAVELTGDDGAARDLSLHWLQPAPAWQTAWRAVETGDGLVLTGWAVVENATGLDWEEVSLTLATGAVQVLAADLYARRFPAAPIQVPGFAPGFGHEARMLAPAMAEAMGADSVADVVAADGASFSRFTLSDPVSLRAGAMISLPFLRETVLDARLLVHRGGHGLEHPTIALVVENPLPLRLPAGVLTYFQAGRGHAGDARVPELAPGARAVLDFARDTALRLREDNARTETLRSLRIADGVMTVTEDLRQQTTYRIDSETPETRELTIEHPLRAGWEVETAGGVAALDATRFVVTVPGQAVSEFVVLERQPRSRRFAVADIDDSVLDLWTLAAPDADTRALLENLAALRRDLAAARRDSSARRAEAEDLAAEQARLVALIVALGADRAPDDAADRARRARVDALDGAIVAARDGARAAQTRAEELEAAIAALIRG